MCFELFFSRKKITLQIGVGAVSVCCVSATQKHDGESGATDQGDSAGAVSANAFFFFF